jgi:5-methylthioadenosine/S-adenosylhomocysteine deaminase
MLRREVDLLLTNISWLVTCNETMPCFRSGALAIDGPDLLAVGPTEQVEQQFRGRSQMDLSGCLVLPGLINTHTHAAMS